MSKYEYLETNLNIIKKEIEQTQKESGNTEPIKLVAVTKTFPKEVIIEGIPLGILDVGENKVQELVEKYEAIGNQVSWHFIGHLQKNKVKYLIDKVTLIHSVESMSLVEELEKRAKAINKVQEILIEVNISLEESKFGLLKEDVIPFLREMKKFPHVKVVGLMTMAPFSDDEVLVRSIFKGLRILKEEIELLDLENVKMKYLSMGMSHDFKWAILEGANIIRVGSSIYGNRTIKK